MQPEHLDKGVQRGNFAELIKEPTRWSDCDAYGHVNNAVYLTYMEAAIMRYLHGTHGKVMQAVDVNTYTVEAQCSFYRAIQFPEIVECAMRVAHLGNSSVRYEFGLFVEGRAECVASGRVVDVFVDSKTEEPVSIPESVRAILAALQLSQL